MSMRIFVTGGTGFVGSPVVDLLLEGGHSVVVFSRHAEIPPRWKEKNATVIQGNLEDPSRVLKAIEGAEIVYHIGEIKNVTAAEAKKNIELARRLAGNLGHAGIKRFVFVSSLTVAGIPATSPAIEETGTAVMLRDQYTEYKRKAEELVREAPGGVEHAIVRPGVVYGPGSRYLARMIRSVARFGPIGLPFIGTGRNHAPLVQVQDLARAIVLAGIRPEAANQTFNIVDLRAHTWLEFLSAIGRAQNRKVKLIPIPPFLIRVPAVLADLLAGIAGFRLDLHTYITFLTQDVVFDPQKARSLLGWEPEHGELDYAVKEMVAWYRGEHRT
jgi:nucleoside-diphosphate-sugar epimerase